MPPKKSHRSFTRPAGIGVKHVTAMYSSLPDMSSAFLNGHVLYLYFTSCGRSRAKTKRELFQHIPGTSQVQTHCDVILNHLDAAVKKLSDKYQSYHKLSDPSEFESFQVLCRGKFPVVPDVPLTVSPANQANEAVPASPSCVLKVPDQSELKTPKSFVVPSPMKPRSVTKCGNCQRLKRSLREMHLKLMESQKEKLLTVRSLRIHQKKPNIVKRLNQKIKRKDQQISKIKANMDSSVLSRSLADAKRQVKSLEKKQHLLKQYHKQKRDSQAGSSKVKLRLEEKLRDKEEEIVNLQTEKMELEDMVESKQSDERETKDNGKQYSGCMRMMVYDAIVGQVPTKNIPNLINKYAIRNGISLSAVPHRSTCETMARELGAISDLQTAEAIIDHQNCTLGFDATTDEGDHVNSVHITTESRCYVVAIDQLAGGTASDYSSHICDSIGNLADVHAFFNDCDKDESKSKIISNISNTLTDRCAANHAAIQQVNQNWDKSLTELNCHLHPLDSVASKCRSSLKQCESGLEMEKTGLFGGDCIAANIVLAMNKMRYEDGRGDPRGFINFLEKESLPRGLLPRYRGNRLHILFHICGVLLFHFEKFVTFLQKGTPCGGLRPSLLKAFTTTTGHVEMQVLGLVGKMLSSPWMKKFYRSAEDQVDHVEGILIVKMVLQNLKAVTDPMMLLTQNTDLFGDPLEASDLIQAVQQSPKDNNLFKQMMSACLAAVVDVLERQYARYFHMDLSEKLREETKSARTHNIDAEEIMGMLSAAKSRAPNATLCYLSSKMWAQKNHTIEYLDTMDEDKRDVILKKAAKLGALQRKQRKASKKDLGVEMMRRQADKDQARETTERRKVEKKLRETKPVELSLQFPDLSEDKIEQISELITGKCVGNNICHVWFEENKSVMYHGKIESVKSKGKKYVVAYWAEGESYDDATDFDMSVFELAADLIFDDLVM